MAVHTIDLYTMYHVLKLTLIYYLIVKSFLIIIYDKQAIECPL